MKLILLTAALMFNELQEIVFLLNLLKMISAKQLMKKECLNQHGSLTDNGRNILPEKSRGIVSVFKR